MLPSANAKSPGRLTPSRSEDGLGEIDFETSTSRKNGSVVRLGETADVTSDVGRIDKVACLMGHEITVPVGVANKPCRAGA